MNTTLIDNIKWLTINETVQLIKEQSDLSVDKSYLYRAALNNKITLSIYFQSPITLKKISYTPQKKFSHISRNLIFIFCHTNPVEFELSNHQLVCPVKTTRGVLFPSSTVWDTKLTGIEGIHIQKALAQSLNLPEPVIGQRNHHSGVIVNDPHGNNYQLFEMVTIRERINNQLKRLKNHDSQFIRAITGICNCNAPEAQSLLNQKTYFPIYQFPEDAVFVIRKEHIIDFLTRNMPQKKSHQTTNRLSTPLARFFWLACKNNPHIGSELINHPYKLLSIFEQWATEEGIHDRLSGETLKTALERGSPV